MIIGRGNCKYFFYYFSFFNEKYIIFIYRINLLNINFYLSSEFRIVAMIVYLHRVLFIAKSNLVQNSVKLCKIL